MFKKLRRWIAESKYPPGWTGDKCVTCGKNFHNRDHLFIVGGEAYHATLECIWQNVPMNKRGRISGRSSIPYLEAKGFVEPGTFE